MKYYKLNNEVFAFDDDQLDLVKPEMAEMSTDETEAHFNPQYTNEQLAAMARAKRDELLLKSQWIVQRHRDQIDSGFATTLTAEQYKSLLAYRQALRDIPEQPGFPIEINWPEFSDKTIKLFN